MRFMMTRRRHGITALGVALGANSTYLAAWSAPTLFYYANVALHVVLGVVALGVLVYLALAARRRTFGAALPWIPFAACAGVGLWLAYTGATLSHQRALDAHGALAALGALSLAVWFGVTAVRAGGAGARGLFAAAATLLILAVAVPIVVKPIVKRRWAESHRIVNPLTAPVAMDGEGGGPSSPFFPSSARTNVGGTIPANFFMTSKSCGRCHKDIYDQWQSSAHHFSSFNNQ